MSPIMRCESWLITREILRVSGIVITGGYILLRHSTA